MRKKITLLLPLFLFLVLAAFLWRGLSLNPHRLPSALIGKEVPHFKLARLYHPTEYLSNDNLSNKVVLVNVWASWCVACHDEHPMLMNIALKYPDIPIYGIDYKDSRVNAIKMLNTLGDPFKKIGFDGQGNVAINFGVYGAPETFIVDKKGIIRYKQIGPITTNNWQHIILPLIRKLQKDAA